MRRGQGLLRWREAFSSEQTGTVAWLRGLQEPAMPAARLRGPRVCACGNTCSARDEGGGRSSARGERRGRGHLSGARALPCTGRLADTPQDLWKNRGEAK